jgi:hypothetical protein
VAGLPARQSPGFAAAAKSDNFDAAALDHRAYPGARLQNRGVESFQHCISPATSSCRRPCERGQLTGCVNMVNGELGWWWTRAPASSEHAGSRNLVELNLHFERHRASVQPMAKQAKAGHVGQGSTASIFDMYTLFSWVVTANICAAFGSALFSGRQMQHSSTPKATSQLGRFS